MAHPAPFDREQLDRELRAMIMEDRAAISHALMCPICDARDVAIQALALAGMDELDFMCADLAEEFPGE